MAHRSPLSDAELRRVLAEYGITGVRHVRLAGGDANLSHVVRVADGRLVVVTVLYNHDGGSAARLASLLCHLEAHRAPSVRLLRTVDGRPVVDSNGTPVTVTGFVAGSCGPVAAAHLPAVGRALAAVHRIPLPAGPLSAARHLPPDWASTVDRFPDGAFAAWVRDRVAHTGYVTGLPDRRVLAHGDLFADNVVVTPDGAAVLLDWETAAVDRPLPDVGMALVGLTDGDAFDHGRAGLFLDGYGRPGWTPDELRDATVHAATVVAFHRYVRHHLLGLPRRKPGHYDTMVRLAESVGSRGGFA